MLFISTSYAFLSKDWASKEMACYRTCMVEKDYDAYQLSNTIPYTCTCKVIKLTRKQCKYLNEKEYLQKFQRFKKFYINKKIKPMFARYQKYYPKSTHMFNRHNIKLSPSNNGKNLIIQNI